MSSVYETYFGAGDVSYGKAKMMRDIKERRLSGQELAELIDALEARGMLTGKPFTPKSRESWDEKYLSTLSNGHISDYFSRDYLEYFAEVAEEIANKRRRFWMRTGAVLAVLAAILLACCFLSPDADAVFLEPAEGVPAKSAPPQIIRTHQA